jgi:hypothetical protein
MRRLECGCELLMETGQFVSLCESHGNNLHSRLEANKHPRHTIPSVDQAFERELIRILVPVVFGRDPHGSVLDPETCAEKLFQCVKAITKRLD